MKHAKLSPSSSHRWLVCPGSVEANVGKPHTENFYALEGTTAHGLLEVCLRLGSDPTEFLGWVLEDGHLEVTEDMADGVGYALDFIRAYLANNPKTKVLVEHQVHYGASIGTVDDNAFGHADVILDNYPAECVALDYKHGIGITVSVKDNSQLRLYSAGMRQQRGRYHWYRQVVIQPRLPRRKPVQEASITDAQLKGWLGKTVIPIVPVALGRNAPRMAGSHCRYCHADGRCQAQYEHVQAAASKEFKKAAKDPKTLTPAQVGRLLDMLDTLNRIGEAVKQHAVAQAHAGVTIPGWESDWTAARRKWLDEAKAAGVLLKLGVPKAERYVTELVSPAVAEDMLKKAKKWPKKPRGSAAEDFTDPFTSAGVLGYSERKPTISRIT